jgi:YVTN family beta-propeller protein
VYVTNELAGTVSAIDATSKAVVATIAVAAFSIGVAIDAKGSRIYVARATAPPSR